MRNARFVTILAVAVVWLLPWPPPASGDTDGILQRGDLVFVEVLRHPELSTAVQVDANGTIELPYIGRATVAGMTEKDAQALVTEAFQRILRNPRVTLTRSDRRGLTGHGARTELMRTEVVSMRGIDAETVSSALQGMTSEGGAISFEPKTNTIVITDTPSTIQNVVAVIEQLDRMQTQKTQVFIEAKLAEVRVGAMRELGIRWFAQGTEGLGGYYPPTGRDATLRNNALVTGEHRDASALQDSGRRFVAGEEFDRRLQVPIQVPTPGQFFLGLLNSHVDIGVILDALIADDNAELLANPKTLATNHTEARIEMVDEFPYTEYGLDFAGRSTYSVKFMDLGIKLSVTPHVYEDEGGPYVVMELEPEVSYATGVSDGVPIRSVRRTQTVARVRDQQTLAIGGIYRNDKRDVEQAVPGLGKVPIIGRLFKRTEKRETQTELLILVTPTIHENPETVTWDEMLNISRVVQGAAIAEPEDGPDPAND